MGAAALIPLASLRTWLFAGIGVQPSIRCEKGVICVDNLCFRIVQHSPRFSSSPGMVGSVYE